MAIRRSSTFSDHQKLSVKDSIISDNTDSCAIVKEYYEEIIGQFSEEENKIIKDLAVARGKTGMVEIFGIEEQVRIEPDDLLKKIPKDEEFEYYDGMVQQILPMVEGAEMEL